MALPRRKFLAGTLALVASRAFAAPPAPAAPAPAMNPGPVYGALIVSPIVCGQLLNIDVSLATGLHEVLAVFTPPIADRAIYYRGQPLGMVVATTQEAAEAAAQQCTVSSQPQPPILSTPAALNSVQPSPNPRDDEQRGDADLAIFQAELLLKQSYRTAAIYPNSVIWPELREPQPANLNIGGPALKKELTQWIDATSAQVSRSVRLLLSRTQAQVLEGNRPETIQTVTLAAGKDGRLRAIVHRSLNDTGKTEPYVERCGLPSRRLYRCDNVTVVQKLLLKNIAPPSVLPGAGFAPGLFALESALDELAYMLKLDPVRLRLINHLEADESDDEAAPKKQLRECYRIGMERIGWEEAPRQPRSHREGKLFLGVGMASAMDEQSFGAHFVRVAVDAEQGTIRVLRHIAVLDVGALVDAEPVRRRALAAVRFALENTLTEGPHLDLESGRVVGYEALGGQPRGDIAPIDDIEVLFAPGSAASDMRAAAVIHVATAGVAAAVANAVYAAVGARLTMLPLHLPKTPS